MTQPSLRPPVNLQPRPKAGATFRNSSINANAAATPPQLSRPSSTSRQSSPTRPIQGSDASDRAAAALVRRVLCPNVHAGSTDPRPIDDLLPPLTSSNEIDLQLYAIIAIVVKELVQSWYGKITPDQGFVEEVLSIIAHCTRALEGRLRAIDLEALIFDEIPGLVENHVVGQWQHSRYHIDVLQLMEKTTAYRISHPPIPPSLATDPRVIYHNLNPHPALSPIPDPTQGTTTRDQSKHEVAYRQLLVQGALAVLLPTEDLENAFLRTLVSDVIGETVLGNAIGGKVSEGWFIWGSIVKIVDVVNARIGPRASGEEVETDTRSRLERYGLVSEQGQSTTPTKHSLRSMQSKLFWRILQYGYFIFFAIRFLVLGLVAASSQTPQPLPCLPKIVQGMDTPPIAKIIHPPNPPPPILNFKIFSLISVLLNLPLRMPWLSGSLSLIKHQLIHGPFEVGATNGWLNQYLHYLLATYLHPPTLAPLLLSSLRTSLFPNSSLPPPSPAPPSAAQQLALKRACARSIISLFPPAALRRFFSTATLASHSEEEEEEDQEAAILRQVELELDIWGDAYLNRHLAYSILELVLVRLLPEMGEKGVRGLMEVRGAVE